MKCFVCSEEVQGDPKYLEWHVNSCLDRQSNSIASQERGSAQSVTSRHDFIASGTLLKAGPQHSSSAASSHQLTLQALQSSLDQQAAVALSVSMQADAAELAAVAEATDSSPFNGPMKTTDRCPSCDTTWQEMHVSRSEAQRSRHIKECFENQHAFEAAGQTNGGAAERGFFDWTKTQKAKDVQGTSGLVNVLRKLLDRSHKDGKITSAYLASDLSMHIGTQVLDVGWGCGYRNMQMIFAAARQLRPYSHLHGDRSTLVPIPSILDFQHIIEAAWNQGYDPPGAAYFGCRLVGKRRWIGPTEAYCALTWLGIRAIIVDFPIVPGRANGAHKALVKWILSYFAVESTPPLGSKHELSDDEDDDDDEPSSDAFSKLMRSRGRAVRLTNKQPLYLQHQGHSRTVVGIEVGKGGEFLLLFDPGKRVSHTMASAALYEDSVRTTRLSPSSNKRQKSSTQSGPSSSSSSTGGRGSDASPSPHRPAGTEHASSSSSSPDAAHAAFWAETPAIERIWKGKSSAAGSGSGSAARGGTATAARGGGGGGLSSSDLDRHYKLVEPYRVSLTSLSRKKEYQILYVEEGPVLSPGERLARKLVSSVQVVG